MQGTSFTQLTKAWCAHVFTLLELTLGQLHPTPTPLTRAQRLTKQKSFFYFIQLHGMVGEAAMSMCVGVFARVPVLSYFGYTPASGLTGSWAIPCVTAGRSPITSWHSFFGLSLSKSLPKEGLCKGCPLRPCMGASPHHSLPKLLLPSPLSARK